MKKIPNPIKIAARVVRLPAYTNQLEATLLQLTNEQNSLRIQLDEASAQLVANNKILNAYKKQDDRIADIQHQLSVKTEKTTTQSAMKAVNETVADNHLYDKFYKAFEDKFRGSEDEISLRLEEHLDLFQSLPKKLTSKSILDIGCGRGEWLSLLTKNRFKAIGIDMNEAMVKRANEMGLTAYNQDALSYLQSQSKNSLVAVTGFHIVEHIPFESLIEIFKESYRAIDHGGFALFETPNPETFSVGAHTFYLDPSHLRPVPPDLLSFMLEYCGFTTEIIRLHQIDALQNKQAPRYVKKLYEASFGPADYAVIARKL